MAKYRDIAENLRTRIADGEFPVGSRLPGLPDLVTHYGVAVNTVRAAQEILREEGLLRISQGDPTTVIKTPNVNRATLLDRMREARDALDQAIKMVEESL